MRGDWAANILVVDITEELESCLKAIISCECRTPDFQCLPVCQIIEENWIISIFVKLVHCLFGLLLQRWGLGMSKRSNISLGMGKALGAKLLGGIFSCPEQL